jgi:hypothetical protein
MQDQKNDLWNMFREAESSRFASQLQVRPLLGDLLARIKNMASPLPALAGQERNVFEKLITALDQARLDHQSPLFPIQLKDLFSEARLRRLEESLHSFKKDMGSLESDWSRKYPLRPKMYLLGEFIEELLKIIQAQRFINLKFNSVTPFFYMQIPLPVGERIQQCEIEVYLNKRKKKKEGVLVVVLLAETAYLGPIKLVFEFMTMPVYKKHPSGEGRAPLFSGKRSQDNFACSLRIYLNSEKAAGFVMRYRDAFAAVLRDCGWEASQITVNLQEAKRDEESGGGTIGLESLSKVDIFA